MAEWRRVDRKLYSDKKIMRLSRDARLLFIGMITIAGDDGYGDADSCVLKAQLFPGDDLKTSEIESWRDELHGLGLIRLWSRGPDLFYNLPNWQKYQVVNYDRRGCKKHLLDINGLTVVALHTERVPSEHREHSTDSTVHTKEQELKTSAPKTAPVVDNSNSTKPTQKQGPSPAQVDNREDVEELVAMFNRRFPDSDKEMTPAVAQQVLEVCKAEWRHPQWLIEQVRINSDHPINYLYALLKKRPFPEPADGERAFWKWDRWRDRKRPERPVGNCVGSVVNSVMEKVR